MFTSAIDFANMHTKPLVPFVSSGHFFNCQDLQLFLKDSVRTSSKSLAPLNKILDSLFSVSIFWDSQLPSVLVLSLDLPNKINIVTDCDRIFDIISHFKIYYRLG